MEERKGATPDNRGPDSVQRFNCFLAIMECEKIPEVLFWRAAKNRSTWGPTGDLMTAPSLVPSWLPSILEEEYGHTRNRNDASVLRRSLTDLATRASRNTLRKFVFVKTGEPIDEPLSANRIEQTLFDILFTVMYAFPEPCTEILWREAEAQLWELVESTCLPFLAVVDFSDVLRYIHAEPAPKFLQSGTSAYLVAFTKFVQRLLVILKFKNYPNLLHLSTQTVVNLQKESEHGVYSGHILFLEEMNEILRITIKEDVNYQFLVRLQVLPQKGRDERSNAALQLAILSSFPDILSQGHSKSALLYTADYLSSLHWSPIQVIAKTHLIGAQLVLEAIGPSWTGLPLTVRSLVAFRAIHDKIFAVARQILEPTWSEFQKTYGTNSTEFIIMGTMLVLCYNALAMERDAGLLATNMINAIWTPWKGRKSDSITVTHIKQVRSLSAIHLFVAYSDSLIGRGMYEPAKQLLLSITQHQASSRSVSLLCFLRILKINRRDNTQAQSSESWDLLEMAINLLDDIPSDMLYQCFEEAICMLSSVHSLETVQIARAETVISALYEVDLSHFHGSNTKMLMLQKYRQELDVYTKVFKRLLNRDRVIEPQRAAERGKPEKRISSTNISLPVDAGANVNFTSKPRITSVMLAIKNQRPNVLEKLISKGAKLNVPDDSGIMPLALASQGGNVTIMEYLLERGANVDDGSLHDAARKLRCDAMRVLMKHHHDPDFPSDRHGGRSALAELCYKAVDSGPRSEDLEEAVQCLIDNNANYRQQSLAGKTIFHYALDSSDPIKILKVLLKNLWRVINEDCFLFMDGQYTYSLTEYVQKGLALGPEAQNKEVIELLRKTRALDRMWANYIDTPQPADCRGAPKHIEEAVNLRKILETRKAETSDFSQFQVELKPLEVTEESKILQIKTEEENRRKTEKVRNIERIAEGRADQHLRLGGKVELQRQRQRLVRVRQSAMTTHLEKSREEPGEAKIDSDRIRHIL